MIREVGLKVLKAYKMYHVATRRADKKGKTLDSLATVWNCQNGLRVGDRIRRPLNLFTGFPTARQATSASSWPAGRSEALVLHIDGCLRIRCKKGLVFSLRRRGRYSRHVLGCPGKKVAHPNTWTVTGLLSVGFRNLCGSSAAIKF